MPPYIIYPVSLIQERFFSPGRLQFSGGAPELLPLGVPWQNWYCKGTLGVNLNPTPKFDEDLTMDSGGVCNQTDKRSQILPWCFVLIRLIYILWPTVVKFRGIFLGQNKYLNFQSRPPWQNIHIFCRPIFSESVCPILCILLYRFQEGPRGPPP